MKRITCHVSTSDLKKRRLSLRPRETDWRSVTGFDEVSEFWFWKASSCASQPWTLFPELCRLSSFKNLIFKFSLFPPEWSSVLFRIICQMILSSTWFLHLWKSSRLKIGNLVDPYSHPREPLSVSVSCEWKNFRRILKCWYSPDSSCVPMDPHPPIRA